MRSIFEDSDARTNIEDAKKAGSKTLPVILCLVAFVAIGSTFGVYRWVETRPPLERPPDPANLQDARQTYAAFSKFNRFITEENWAEAANMLSAAGLQRLKDQNKTLRESILSDKYKDMRVAQAAVTDSIDRGLDRVRQDCIYTFDNGETIIVPLYLVIENEKLVIDAWADL
jgi:hypothetical protein